MRGHYSTKNIFYVALFALITFSSPASASHSLQRGQIFINSVNSLADSALVPGGDSTARGDVLAAFGIQPADGSDTLKTVTFLLRATANTFPADSVVSTARLFVDLNGNQAYDAGDSEISQAGAPAAANKGNDTAIYSFSSISRRLPATATTESYLILIETQYNLFGLDRDTIQIIFRAFDISVTDAPGVDHTVPAADTDFPTFRFRVDTTTVAISNLTTTVVHPDSRAFENPFNLLTGTIQGETRTLGGDGDSVTRVGIAIRGSAAAQIDSVFVLIGAAARRFDMSANGSNAFGDSLWTTSTIDTQILGAGVTDTFIVRARVRDTVANNDTVSAFIPADSVATKLRYALAAATDSSGVVKFTKPTLAVTAVAFSQADSIVHPDSRARSADSFTVLQAFVTLGNSLTHDTVTTVRVAFEGTASDSVYTPEVRIGSSATWFAMTKVGATDTYQRVGMTSLINPTTDSLIQIRTRIADTITAGRTLFARIYIAGCTATFHETGPAAATDSSAIFTIRKPNIGATARALFPYDTFIHIDSRARSVDSITILQGNFVLAGTITYDTITSIRVSFAGTRSDSVIAPEIRIGSSASWFAMARIGATDSYLASGLTSFINATTDSGFTIRTRIADTVAPNGTLWAQLQNVSCTTTFHETGPLTATDSSIIFTLGQSALSISVTALSQADSVIHPDSRFRSSDSVTVLEGAFTLSLPATYDTLTEVNVSFSGTASDSVYTPEVQVRATGAWTALARVGVTDTYRAIGLNINIVSGDTYRVRTRFADTVTTGRTLFARFNDSSVRATLSDSAPLGNSDSSIIYTIRRPNIGVTALAISQSDTVLHPDSRVRGVDSFTIFSGFFTMNGGVTYDTLTQMQIAFAGTASDSVYTPEARIGSSATWIPLVRVGTTDTYRALALSSAINGSADSGIIVRTRLADTVTLLTTLRAQIYAGFDTPTIHETGPLIATDSSVQFTFRKPRIGVNVTFDTNRNVHRDSRARTATAGTDSFTVMVGSFTVDSAQLGFPTYDTVVQLAVAFAGTTRDSILVPQVSVGVNGWVNLVQIGTTDTYVATLNLTIRNQDTIAVRGTLKLNSLLGGTLSAYVGANNCTTTFASAGPAAQTDSSGVITCTTPIFRTLATFVANDTILPAFAFTNAFVVGAGRFNIDTSLLTYDTLTTVTVSFRGTASDSIYNARIRIGANGALQSLVKVSSGVSAETFTLTTDSRIVDNDTWEIRVNIADTTTIGTTFNVRLAASANTTTLSTTGSGVATESSGIFTISADPLRLGMVILGDTQIPPWQQLGSNPTLVLEGTIYTDSGAVLMLTYDTLTRFGVSFETSHVDVKSSTDSILAVQLSLLANAVRVADTISLVQDTGLGNGLRWKLPAGSDTNIDTAQRFQVYVRVASSESLIYDTISAHILRDSVATRFTSAPSGDTHSGRVITYRYPDTTLIVQDTTITDTTINPDSAALQNPFIIFRGSIRGQTNNPNGQQWLPAAGDTLTYFAIDLFDNPNNAAADSITNVVAYVGPFDSPIVLAKVGSVPGSPATIRITNWRSPALDSRLRAPNNTETFYVRATVADTVVLGTRIQARMFTDSMRTFFMADSVAPSYEITGSRQVTFARANFSVSTVTLGDTTVSPFRVRNDSTLAFEGTILTSETPRDSVIRFGVRLVGSSRIFGESVQVRIKFDTGTAGAVAYDSLLVLVNANSTSPTFRLNDTFTVDSGQTFRIRVTLLVDTPLIGETFTMSMPADSTAARFSTGGNLLLASGRTALINYTDSLVITDSVLGAITIHPSIITGQNPYAAFIGRIGNRSGLSDSVQRIRFRFVGTAVGANDSIAAAYVLLNAAGETMNLARIDTVTWGINLNDSAIAAGSFMACTLYVTISETVASNTNLQATVPTDSISLLYSEDTALFTASRVATFNRGQMNITTTARIATYPTRIQLGDTKEVMWFTAISGGQVEADTLHALYIRLVGADSSQVDTIFLARDAGRNQRFDSAGALADTRVGTFVFDNGETWRLVIAPTAAMITDTITTGSKSDTAEYLVVLRLRTTATCTSVRVTVPALGADGPFTDSGPAAAVTYDSYAVVAPDTTAPLPPSFFRVTPSAGSFLIEWGPGQGGNDDMNAGQYNLYWDSAARQYPITVLTVKTHDTGTTTYSHTISAGLVTDSEYRFRIAAQDGAGNEGTSGVITAVSGVPAAQVAVMHQPAAGDKVVRARTFTVVARIKDKTTAALVTGVRFDSRALSTSGNFAQIGSISTDSFVDNNGEYFYSMTFDASTTAPDSYDIRAVARTSSGFDSAPTSASIQLLIQNDTPNATLVLYTGDSTHSADSAYLERVITDDFDVTLILQSASRAFDVGLTLKAGAIGTNDTARIVLDLRKDTTPAAALSALRAAGLIEPEYFVNISIISTSNFINGETLLVGTGHTIALSYIDNNNDFVDDSTGVDMRKATIYTLTSAGLIEALSTERNHTLKILFATITHFSPYFISNAQGINTVGLNRLIVGPNPFRPNDGNDQTGKPFVAGDATTGIVFLNLPPNTKIEIYTILGEKITELNNNATGASIAWSVKNDNNKDVASGYYLYVVTDPATGQRVTGKVAVIR